MSVEPGPWHRWFAWHPVETNWHGWKWLIFVERQRRWHTELLNWGYWQWCYRKVER